MRLRPMDMSDADFMLELKNYPETRKFAIASHEVIDSESHYRWLRKHLQYFRVIVNGDDQIGVIRYFANEVSIWIDRKYWGLGIATRILQEFTKEGDLAKIVDGNIASMRAFIKAGFIPVQHSSNVVYTNGTEKTSPYYLLSK
jgi:RimJ/RimL family protein N-acetyltransferase